jgi:hypothetical protein
MKVLFFMTHPGHVRNFESTLRALCRRGHRVHVAFDREKEGLPGQHSLVAALDRECEQVSFGRAPVVERSEEWTLIAWQLRAMLDYLRYLEPPLATATRLRWRASREVPRPLVKALDALDRAGARAFARRSLGTLERSVPPRKSVLRFLSAQEPDLVAVTPLLDLGSPQLDYVRAAKSAGVATCLCVASWDNLTNKGRLHELPAAVTVWNEDQRREAVELHRVPAARVTVTGAQPYDHWFARQAGRSSAELLGLAGLPPGRPFVLYTGSSPFLAPDEGEWIVRWARALREAKQPSVREAGLLVRPHPLSPLDESCLEALESIEGVAVWPRHGQNPVDDATRADYFDSMFHAAAVVGLNTSAMIEAAIVGSPVLTVVRPDSPEGQEGTLHFRYLLAENGGPAVRATSLDEHAAQLACALGDEPPATPATTFLARFVRPHGLDEPATPRLVDALEEAAACPAESPEPVPLAATAARPLLALGGSIGLRLRRRRARRNVPASQLSCFR